MELFDARGRIGGRLNLIDAIVVSAVIGLALTGYGGYVLFRTPTPELLSVSPTLIYQGQDVKVTVTGKNLRPYMHITFKSAQARSDIVLWDGKQLVTARSYVLGNTTFATLEMPDLVAGIYDVELWNERQEVARLPRALTVLGLARTPILEVDVRGAFTRLVSSQIKDLRAGARFPPGGSPTATVVSIGTPESSTMEVRTGATTVILPINAHFDLSARLRVRCFTLPNIDGSVRCAVAGPAQPADVAPGSSLLLNGPDGWIPFRVSEVLPAATPQ
jgi:hypothetical protein